MALLNQIFDEILKKTAEEGKPTKTVNEVIEAKKGSKEERERLQEIVEVMQKVNKNVQTSLNQTELNDSLSELDERFKQMTDNLLDISKSVEKFLDPKKEMNKEEAEHLQSLVATDKRLIGEINESRKQDNDFDEEIQKIEKEKQQKLRRQGIAEEEQRKFEKKFDLGAGEIWKDIRENIQPLSTGLAGEIGEGLIAGITGPVGILFNQLRKEVLAPVFAKFKETEIGKEAISRVKGFFGFKEKEEVAEVELEEKIEPEAEVEIEEEKKIELEEKKKIETEGEVGLAEGKLEGIKEEVEKVNESIADLSEPSIGDIRKTEKKERRIRKSDPGRKFEIESTDAAEKTAEMTESLVDQSEDLKSQLLTMTDPLVDIGDKSSVSLSEIKDEVGDSLDLARNVSDETARAAVIQDKVDGLTLKQEEELIKNIIEGNVDLAELATAGEIEAKKEDLMRQPILDNLEIQQEVWDDEENHRVEQKEFWKKNVETLDNIEDASGSSSSNLELLLTAVGLVALFLSSLLDKEETEEQRLEREAARRELPGREAEKEAFEARREERAPLPVSVTVAPTQVPQTIVPLLSEGEEFTPLVKGGDTFDLGSETELESKTIVEKPGTHLEILPTEEPLLPHIEDLEEKEGTSHAGKGNPHGGPAGSEPSINRKPAPGPVPPVGGFKLSQSTRDDLTMIRLQEENTLLVLTNSGTI